MSRRAKLVARAIAQIWVGWLGGVIQAVCKEAAAVIVLPRIILVEVGDLFLLLANIVSSFGVHAYQCFAVIHMAIDPTATSEQTKAQMPPWFREMMEVRSGPAPEEQPHG